MCWSNLTKNSARFYRKLAHHNESKQCICWIGRVEANAVVIQSIKKNPIPFLGWSRVEANAVVIQSIKKNPIPFLGSEKNHHEILVFSSSFQRKMLWFFCCDFEFVKLMKTFYWYVIDNLCNGFQFTFSLLKSPQLQKTIFIERKIRKSKANVVGALCATCKTTCYSCNEIEFILSFLCAFVTLDSNEHSF